MAHVTKWRAPGPINYHRCLAPRRLILKYDPQIHHRRSIRLTGYDYSQEGAYFVTICLQSRVCLFGEIIEKGMNLNDAGEMIERWWAKLENKFQHVEIDEFVVMPNHFHGIVSIVGADLCVCPAAGASSDEGGAHVGAPLHRRATFRNCPRLSPWVTVQTPAPLSGAILVSINPVTSRTGNSLGAFL